MKGKVTKLMMYEEKKEIRKQIGQLLADAGLNQATIKEMVELEIKNKVDRAVEQVIAKLDAESPSGNYLKDRANKYLQGAMGYTTGLRDVVRDELKNRVIQVVLKNVEEVEE